MLRIAILTFTATGDEFAFVANDGEELSALERAELFMGKKFPNAEWAAGGIGWARYEASPGAVVATIKTYTAR